jgi:hypothetical protein
MNPKKPRRAWVYLDEAAQERVATLTERFPRLKEVAILSDIIDKALAAVEENGFNLPSRLRVHPEGNLLNEPKKTTYRRT